MIEPVNAEEFVSQPERRKPEQFQYVKFRIEDGVARMTLNRPSTISQRSDAPEIADGITTAGERDDVKLIVLDLPAKFSAAASTSRIHLAARLSNARRVSRSVRGHAGSRQASRLCRECPAIGGGAELAAFGDLVIATPKARFAQPEISIGVFPPLASTILPFLVGPKIALELVLTGEPVTAERALELGMVNRLVPEVQLDKP